MRINATSLRFLKRISPLSVARHALEDHAALTNANNCSGPPRYAQS